MREVLVTGAAGFAGSHLVDLLESEGVAITAWRRPGEALPAPPTGRTCRWVDVDVLDRRAVADAVADARPSVVYHLAGFAHAGRSWDLTRAALEVNILGTHHLPSALAACRSPARILVAGSSHVYGDLDRAATESDPIAPSSPYGLSKLAQEMAGLRAASEDGLAVVVSRSYNHIGPRQDPSFFSGDIARRIALAERGMAPPALAVGNLESRRDLCDVRDTVRAYRRLAERGRTGAVYNVCSGRPHRIGDILDGLLRRAAVPIHVTTDPARFRPHDPPLILGDCSRLREETGWTPRFPMDQTLDDLLAYWRRAVATT